MAQAKLPCPGRWRAYRTPAVVAPSAGGVQPVPATIHAYADDGAVLAAFLANTGYANSRPEHPHEHVDASIVAELERSPMAKMRPPKIPEKARSRGRVIRGAICVVLVRAFSRPRLPRS